ncbi:hypothetical protein Q0F98_02940 [Paenibacillus amylolyticus]|nr:hypothetical protein Q0F98_02940 [Paenibacillus amylolyticus]
MNLTAMLVDDELPILENLNYILPWEEMGIEITGTARSGAEALGKVTESHPTFSCVIFGCRLWMDWNLFDCCESRVKRVKLFC